MNVSSTSSTPGNVGASTASSSNSSPYADYLNGNQQRAANRQTTNNVAGTSGLSANNPSTNNDNSANSSKISGSTSSALLPGLEPTDHLQRLAQMTQGVGLVKNEGDSSTSNPITAGLSNDPFYQSAAATAYLQYGNWQNYYQQFPQMVPNAPFPGWPPHYTPSQWQNYAQTKKGRQTYQRYQTSVLESKFQQSSYVSKKQREELRLQTNLTDRQIKIWFQNRRMKAKKEKNRCEDQTEHSTLLPPNNGAKSLSSLNGSGGANGSNNLMSGASLGMLGGQHLLNDEALLGLMEHEDGKQQLKMSGLHGMMPSSTTTSPMWSTAHSVQAAAAGAMLNSDQLNAWPQILPQSAHQQSNQYAMHNPYMSYSLCPPNI